MRSDPAKSAGESRAKTHEALPERKKGRKKDIKKERLKNNETRKNTRPLASASVFWSRFPFHACAGLTRRGGAMLGAKSDENRSWDALGALLVVFGLLWSPFGVSWCLSGLPGAFLERFWSHVGTILGRFWMDFSKRRGDCFFTCFSFGFSCTGALKVVFFALAATRAPKQSDRENTWFFVLFQTSLGRRGRRAEGKRGQQNET